MGQEQRQFNRVPQIFSVRCRPAGALQESWQVMSTLDMSAGGISLQGESFFESEEALEIELQWPGVAPLVLRGRLVRSHVRAPASIEYALEFIEVTPEQQIKIDTLVQFLKKSPRRGEPLA